ncbi:DNA/RNA non-specific endonuclease [Bacillus pacificus]
MKKMYQLGEKIAKSIDDRTAKSASFEVDGNGLLISKQGGTDFQSWVNKHHTESNKIIDDKIKGVEASLASKGTGETPKITEIKEKDLGKHIIKGKNGRKELAPNVRYITEDGYKYTTDELGRIVDVEAGELILQKGKRNTGMQVAAGREDRLPDDDGGHLIGTQFHGSGDIDNLVAQNKQINRSGGEWYNMEKEWANALGGKPPKKVSVKIEPVYSGQSMRPNSFMVEYQIQGKKPVIREILNKAGGK